MASGPITSWQIKGEKVEAVTDFPFLGSKTTEYGNCSHEIRWLLLCRKTITNLDSVLKSEDITLMSQGCGLSSSLIWMWAAAAAAAAAKSLQSCPTLCDPIDGSPLGSSVPGILQARVELDHKEGRVPKNWCFQTVVLEKTLEGLLDSKEIKPGSPALQADDLPTELWRKLSNSWSLLKFMSIESVMPSNHLIFSHPLLCLPSIFPSIRVFSSESVLHIR